MTLWITALALAVERLTGYPDTLYRAIGHPVTWIGAAISFLEQRLNGPRATRWHGVIALLLLLAPLVALTTCIALTLRSVPYGWVAEALLATPLLAQKSMGDHVRAVRAALDRSLPEARVEVAKIVGRDPAQLDESGIAKAALESLAENTSDGIVAPAFWLALGGLPGIALYKAVNTADSMIGHTSERYLHFGWAAARLDDLLNLIPARLCGLLFAAAGGAGFIGAVKAMWRDAPRHVSPNAGWPEAALADVLGLQFGGPRSYGGRMVDLATMGSGRTDMSRHDIDAGLKVYDRLLWLLLAISVAAAWASM